MAFEDYDVSKAFERIEDELIASMMRNLRRHLKEEDELGFDWSQWQVEQLRYLQEYRKRNKKKFGPQFKEINKKVVEAIRDAADKGGKDEEKNILKQLTGEQVKRHGRRGEASVEGAGDAFFRINDKKLEALVKATNDDLTRAEHAVLRRTNDQYRKIIFDAQVYANTGAGTIEQAIDMATKDFLSRGIDCIEYKNGARHTIKDYADMYIRTAERRAYLMGEGQKRQEWGEELVIVNKRGGHPCLHCIPWLGKVLIDDVYSGGKPDGKHKLLSDAMAAGFLHPRCKDGFTTYFPGISSAPDPDAVTKKDLQKAVKAEKEEARESYAQRQAEKYERLAEHSLDPDNRRNYEKKAEQWEETAERLKVVEEPQAVPAKTIDPEHQKEIDEALEYYVSGEGMYVNEHLAGLFEENGGVWTEEDEELLKLLDEGTQEDVKEKKLWRSVDASAVFGDISSSEFWDLQSYITYGESSLTPDRAAKIKKLLSVDGSEITEPRLMSTTKDKQIAFDWGSFSGSDKPIVLELDVPEGIKGVDLERFDLPDDPQKEVLLARGQRYRIKSIESEDGQIVVKAELIPKEVLDRERKLGKLEEPFDDITEELLGREPQDADYGELAEYVSEGETYCVGDAGVVQRHTEKEKDLARWFSRITGKAVRMVPEISGPNNKVKTPDFIAEANERWEEKDIKCSGKDPLRNEMSSKKAENYIFDVSRRVIEMDKVLEFARQVFSSYNTQYVENVYIVENGNLIKAYKRKNKDIK